MLSLLTRTYWWIFLESGLIYAAWNESGFRDFDPVCACDEEEKAGGGQRQSRDRVGPAPALSPSITVTVMWLWAVLVLCHYIHNACCLSQHTHLSPRYAGSHTHTCTCTNWMFWQTQRKKTEAWIKAAEISDCSEIAVIYFVFFPTAAGSVVFWRACAYLQPPSCWMSWTGRRL